jgi:hypothetical protein
MRSERDGRIPDLNRPSAGTKRNTSKPSERRPSLACPSGCAYDALLLRRAAKWKAQTICIWNVKPSQSIASDLASRIRTPVTGSAIAYRNSAIAASNASLGGRTRSCGSVANGSSVMFSMSRNVGLSGLT